MTPLMIAAKYRKDPVFTEIIIDTRQCNPHYRRKQQSSSDISIPNNALECAVDSNNLNVFKVLIKQINWKDKELIDTINFIINNINKIKDIQEYFIQIYL